MCVKEEKITVQWSFYVASVWHPLEHSYLGEIVNDCESERFRYIKGMFLGARLCCRSPPEQSTFYSHFVKVSSLGT